MKKLLKKINDFFTDDYIKNMPKQYWRKLVRKDSFAGGTIYLYRSRRHYESYYNIVVFFVDNAHRTLSPEGIFHDYKEVVNEYEWLLKILKKQEGSL